MILALEIFTRSGGVFASTWAHVLVGIMWIGLLYYFNFVQVPAFAELDAQARNQAIDKVASRALWWFRWSALATVITGLLILWAQDNLSSGTYFKLAPGASIATGTLLALVMFLNVWGVIWRNQKVVIANARNVLAGGEANPTAAAFGRKTLLASRQNMIFSLPMLFFMLWTHLNPGIYNLTDNRGIYWLVTLIIVLVFELNCLGIIGGTGQNITNKIYESHINSLITGAVLVVVWYALWEILFKTI